MTSEDGRVMHENSAQSKPLIVSSCRGSENEKLENNESGAVGGGIRESGKRRDKKCKTRN